MTLIHEWYMVTSSSPANTRYSRCKIKAVPSNAEAATSNADILYSVDDTIHLDIINVGYGKEV